MLKIMKVHSTIGSTCTPKIKSGCCLKKCTDGSDGRMELMCSLQINQKQDGTMFLIEDLTLLLTLCMENTFQSTSITTISIPTCTSSQERQEELMEPIMDSSYLLVSSLQVLNTLANEKHLYLLILLFNLRVMFESIMLISSIILIFKFL